MSRSYRFLAPLLIALAIALAGCGKPEDKLVGTYTGKQQLSQETLTKLGKAAKALQDMSLTLNLNKDKTASLTAPGQPAPINGTWTYESNQVQVAFSGSAGGPPMKLNPSPDNKTLTLDMSGSPQVAQMGTIVFTKS